MENRNTHTAGVCKTTARATPKNAELVLIEYHEIRQGLQVIAKRMTDLRHCGKHFTPEFAASKKEHRRVKLRLKTCLGKMYWVGAELKHGTPATKQAHNGGTGADCCKGDAPAVVFEVAEVFANLQPTAGLTA